MLVLPMARKLQTLCVILGFVILSPCQGDIRSWGNLTLIESAVGKGAVCLDGSAPGYYYSEGIGSGVNNWIIMLEPGGWCASDAGCIFWRDRNPGSTKQRDEIIYFGLIISEDETVNPDFYEWNRVRVIYCDGSSFLGDVDPIDLKTNLSIRGSRIFDAVIDDLLTRGMKDASNVILSGMSAGGLATILHCDSFRALLPNAERVKCISDSGFFIHGKELLGSKNVEGYFASVVAYHNITKFLPEPCTFKGNSSLCFFPEYIVAYLKTPLFLIESEFDPFQLIFRYSAYDPNWAICANNISLCTHHQLQLMTDYRNTVIETLRKVRKQSPSLGMFVHSCSRHGHFFDQEGWQQSTKLAQKTIQEAVGDWYFDRSPFRHMDTKHMKPRRSCNCTKL